MADLLLKHITAKPVALNYRVLQLIDDGTLKLYVGDSSNLPQLISPLSIIDTKTADATLSGDFNRMTVLVDATTGASTITLPPVADWTGKVITIKKIDSSANAVTVSQNSTETIDGATTQSLVAQYDKISLISDGTNVWII